MLVPSGCLHRVTLETGGDNRCEHVAQPWCTRNPYHLDLAMVNSMGLIPIQGANGCHLK